MTKNIVEKFNKTNEHEKESVQKQEDECKELLENEEKENNNKVKKQTLFDR